MKLETKFDAAIHQPDFLPWLGFFDKIFHAEKLIIFDTVQISSGKSWSSRVKILTRGEEHWLTMPIKKKKRSDQKIFETEMIDAERVWNKLIKTLKSTYAKAPYFKGVMIFLEEEIDVNSNLLGDFNFSFIEKLTRKLGNDRLQFVKCSDQEKLKDSKLLQTDLIIEVCDFFEVSNYVSGSGCLSFLEVEKFEEKKISISFQDYNHPKYQQLGNGEFVPGLSIIDALMNLGFEGVRNILPRC